MSLFGIIERPMIVFRQASSTLVAGKKSFKLLGTFFIYILLIIMSIGMILGYTSIGPWVYTNIFNAKDDMVGVISNTFKVITFVIIFSGIRGIYQGVIINQLETKWLTIGVIARLIAMFTVAYLLVVFDYITSASGRLIFLTGMIVECLVSVYKGHSLVNNQAKETGPRQLRKADISRSYFPLVFYFLMQTILIPIIYIILAKSDDIELSIASFALALSITQMILGFFMYTHQLLLQFHEDNTRKVVKFVIMISIIPTLLLCLLCYAPAGMMFMTTIMGADESLSLATIAVLKFFIIKTLVFPWVDFFNGFLMLKRQTNKMLLAQVGNLIVVVITLYYLVGMFPNLNGVNGSIAASLGELAGFVIISTIVYRMTDRFEVRKYRRGRVGNR